MNNYCIDSGFLIALYARRDQADYRVSAREYFKRFANRANKFVMPWPVMYEAINTRIAGYRPGMEVLARNLREFRQNDQLIKVDDAPYRERALEECFSESFLENRHRGFSLVDCVLRLVLSDTRFRFSGLITVDVPHFRDICLSRNIEMFALGH